MRSTTVVSVVGMLAIVSAALILAMNQPQEPEPTTPLARGAKLFRDQGCSSCHAIGGGVSRGPDLAGLIPRLEQKLEPERYQQRIALVKGARPEIYQRYETQYADILARSGEDQVRTWLSAHLRNPRFDLPGGKMPDYSHLTPQQVDYLIEFLLTLK